VAPIEIDLRAFNFYGGSIEILLIYFSAAVVSITHQWFNGEVKSWRYNQIKCFIQFIVTFLLTYSQCFYHTMYVCFVCGDKKLSVTSLRAHLHKHALVGDLVLPIKCCQSSCNSSFASINNLIRHLNNFHKCEVDLADDLASRPTVEHGTVEHSAGNDGSVSDIDVDDSYAERRAGEDELNVEEIHSEGVALIARLRAKGNIPYNIISDVVSSFNSMASSIVSHVQSVVTRSLVSSGVGENAVKCVESDIKQHTSNVPLTSCPALTNKINTLITTH
jgi:hypothetical protein